MDDIEPNGYTNEDTNMIQKSMNQHVDKLTLEFLTNKSQYNKYLSKSDPKKYEEHMDHYRKINKYKDQIMQITNDYCNNPNTQITTHLDDMFNDYVRSCIQYFEMKELENVDDSSNAADEDTLFMNIDEKDDSTNHTSYKEPTKSFWGKGAKKTNYMNSDLRAFSGKR
jgi:hypothetical protein